MQNLHTSEGGSQDGTNNDDGASSSNPRTARSTHAGKGGPLPGAESGVMVNRVGKIESRAGESSLLGPLPEVGVATTCHACEKLRVSRTVTCNSCGATFHWSCIGFYEHLYRRPKEDWCCKSCTAAKAEGESGVGEGKEEDNNGKEKQGTGVEMAEATQESELGESIDVGVETPRVTPPSALAPPGAAASSLSSSLKEQTEEVKEAVVAPSVSEEGAAGAETATASPAADEPSTATSAGDRVCPVCKRDIGRKRTMDCSVCHTPSHAGCVNVRGAETPKSWVCRDCFPGGARNGEVGQGAAASSNPAEGGETAEVSDLGAPPKILCSP